MIDIKSLYNKAKNTEKKTNKFFKLLKKRKPTDLDKTIHLIHNKVFDTVNCLDCANCCRSISPLLNKNDINRMAKALKMKYATFTKKYICTDEDGDYVFKTTPCPFLLNNNYCMIYEHRPKACREYPHTDRKNILQALKVMQKNRYICPAVYIIIEKLEKAILE